MANTGQRAPIAAQAARREETRALLYGSTGKGSNGIAGTAARGEESSSTAQKQVQTWALGARRLTPTTLRKLDVGFGTDRYRDAETGSWFDALSIRFLYADGAYKARAINRKVFTATKGFQMRFWNLDKVIAGLKAGRVSRVYLFEGELDALAAVEAGVSEEAVLSVPNGAKKEQARDATDDDVREMQKRYAYVDEALEAGLNKATAFVWAGDNDGPGLALRSDMVRIFGAAKFWFVEWPNGDKDANSVLLNGSGEELLDLLTQDAKPWPIAGLYRLSELPEPPEFTLWPMRLPGFDGKINMAPRCLSVATGHPGHGKTAFWAQAWFEVVREHDFRICSASFETHVKPHVRRQLRTLLSGRLEIDMNDQDKRDADAWIDDHYLFMEAPDTPTLKWLLNTAEAAVIRYGARVIQIDPWNYLEGARERGESETDYIGKCLREIRSFAKDLNVHVQILAHPAKMHGDRRTHPPVLEDISGSKHWDNAVDQGFAIHRPQLYDSVTKKRCTEAQLWYLKSRFVDELGFPCVVPLDYVLTEGRYVLGVEPVEDDPKGHR